MADAEMKMDAGNQPQRRRRKRPVYQRGPYKGKPKYPYGWYSKRARTKLAAWHPRGSEGSKNLWGPTYETANDIQKAMRLAMRFKGDGDYKSVLRSIGKYGLRGAGAILGGITGHGAQSGYDAGAKISQYFGLGDYGPISTNSIVSGGGGEMQRISVNNDSLTGDIYFSHTEYLGNVTALTPNVASGSTSFQLKSYDLNPGLKTIPFLSQIASNFELYQWQGLMFQYKPTSGEFGASSISNSLGKIVLATKYGILQDTPFGSMIEMQNYDYAQSSKPSCGMVHGVETDPKQNMSEMLLVRTGVAPSNVPKVLYDLGKLYIATEGIPFSGANQTIVLGELWVTYRCKLSRAKLYDSLGDDIDYYHSNNTSTAGQLYTGTVTSGGSLAVTLTGVVAQPSVVVQFPSSVVKGRFMIVGNHASTAATQTFWNAATLPVNGLTVVSQQAMPNNLTGSTNNQNSVYIAIVDVDSPNQVRAGLQLNRSGNAAGSMFITITQIDPDIVTV